MATGNLTLTLRVSGLTRLKAMLWELQQLQTMMTDDGDRHAEHLGRIVDRFLDWEDDDHEGGDDGPVPDPVPVGGASA